MKVEEKWLLGASGILLLSTIIIGCTKNDETKTTASTSQTTTTTVNTDHVTASQMSTPMTSISASASTLPASTVANLSANNASVSEKKGENLYQNSCRVCHDTGNLGSPRFGDKAAWQERIAQGNEVLYSHAINGFIGKTGVMPAKGGSTATDDEVKAAVDYMVNKSK